MRILAVLMCFAGSSLVWADGPTGVEYTVGWDGIHPVEWATWDDDSRVYHESRMERERTEYGHWFDTYEHEHPDTGWSREESFGLLQRGVNAGLPFEASRDMAQTMVSEKVERNRAHELVKAAVEATVAAEAEDADPSDDDEEYRNLGQWVKAQVHSGLKGQELAAAIHLRTGERKEQKKAEKAAKRQEREDRRENHDPTAQPDDENESPDKGKSHDKGKGQDKGQGKGKGKNK